MWRRLLSLELRILNKTVPILGAKYIEDDLQGAELILTIYDYQEFWLIQLSMIQDCCIHLDKVLPSLF